MITGNITPKSFPDSLPQKPAKKLAVRLGVIGILLLASFALFTAIRSNQFAKLTSARVLTSDECLLLQSELQTRYASQYQILKSLPYNLGSRNLDVRAESAILIDTANGCILYQKNADEVIPPASMTKLFSMYLVEEEVRKGRFSYDQIIPLPPESWACNMPPHSSLMFLGEGQKVTLEELLLGLSICSGNDAAYALAYATCGNMENFVDGMNQIAYDLNLPHTFFEESSGYSEKNTTTAYEMASFCRVYLKNHPQSLKKFHSVRDFKYPKEKNLAPGDKLQPQDFSQGLPRHITMSIYQQNTNPLLGKLEGCDGLKTGYIDESGYNLSLTAERNGTRFLSVTMKGPGSNTAEGQAGRVHDGSELMEWAFSNFFNYDLPQECLQIFTKIYGYKEKSLNLISAWNDAVTIPFIAGQSLDECRGLVTAQINLTNQKEYPSKIAAGQVLGNIAIKVGETELCQIPLVSDRSVQKSNIFVRAADCLIRK
ncbi:D-alanyl-D-alanine carboxypeptidase family protein [Treponema sp. C6A8]|uniref:D-alanyl-D-alanine carboxypeptidase family protein n=1 Tax=Treponema sp. C6A8 TaxID=1410609 RepID=UPI0006889231|nr:D-alanyl-D-alanine carboxypeptidase family protein [Treponema sp. C6A8]